MAAQATATDTATNILSESEHSVSVPLLLESSGNPFSPNLFQQGIVKRQRVHHPRSDNSFSANLFQQELVKRQTVLQPRATASSAHEIDDMFIELAPPITVEQAAREARNFAAKLPPTLLDPDLGADW